MSERERLDQWQLDTSSAEAYERYLVPLFFAPGAQYLIELSALAAGERILDVACGTGIVARSAAARVGVKGKVVGLDLNEGMLEVARTASSKIQPEIEWRRADVRAIPMPEGAFDVVFCQQGLQFFAERSTALLEMRRVLAPEGRLALSVMRPIERNPGYVALAEALDKHVGPSAGAMMRSPFISLTTGGLRDLIAGAGFRDIRILFGVGPTRFPSVAELLRREAASSPLAAPIAALNAGVRDALVRDLEGALREYTDDEGVVFPTEVYFVTARR